MSELRKPVRQPVVGSLAWGDNRPLERQHGRVCVDCGAKLRSYEPHRTRCGPHERFRHDALLAVAVMWSRAQEQVRRAPTSRIRGHINTQSVALAIGILQSPEGGFRGDIAEELSAVLPMRFDKIKAYIAHLKAHRIIEKDEDGWWHLSMVPYPDSELSLLEKEESPGDHSLGAQDLVKKFT